MTKGGKVAVTKGSAQSDGAGEGGMSKAKSSTTFVATGGGSLPAWALKAVSTIVSAVILIYSVHRAYDIRLTSVRLYGELIHEFDPWFNYRATQYLSDNGWRAFFQWYDYMSWYPLGRPVGTTIFPGMQLTGVAIHRVLEMLGRGMSINNICVYIPAWFGSIATVLAALIAYESSNSLSVMAFTAYFFSIVPAHLMRSMAGEFDNECVAMAAMLLTFYMWVRSLRSSSSWPIGALAGVAYGYMVSTWGGYIFVLNMVAFHASVCVLLDWARGTYSVSLLRAYSLFFVIGTALAICVPPVEWTPFRSLEQLTALFVFVFMWALHYSEYLRERARAPIHSSKALQIRARIFMGTLSLLLIVAIYLFSTGYFRSFSSRVRALFVKHTRTGNPLVDSVAEHRPTTAGAFLRHLHVCYNGWIIGFFFMSVSCFFHCTPGMSFLLLYSILAYYFSLKMSRLLLLSAPVASILTGYVVGSIVDLAADCFAASGTEHADSKEHQGKARGKGQKRQITVECGCHNPFYKLWCNSFSSRLVVGKFFVVVVLAICGPTFLGSEFRAHCERFSLSVANPRIISSIRHSGKLVLADDYYVSYLWLRNNTPEDARILSWWDYGYQITGIGNRTTLADGNTWNHEHIATIGKMLTSPVKESHALIRHLADYVLIWSGQDRGDLRKSRHMARIGNSVYRDMCSEDDPLCRQFGFYSGDLSKPTPMMQRSLLYNLHRFGTDGGKTQLDKNMFQLAYVSKYGLVKIYKVMNVSEESKAWVADPKNRKCDAPGSWICAGQYPPAKEIQDMLAKRIDYEQLEDFNRRNRSDAHYRAYMRQMG
ncbi:oligosaccharyl transferase subunit, putative [Trypanosoma brucei gambiense DAL972]|uniref:dolichyl-diphosphooligosaccharide--protein glycotransferase n=1 Tax=Trypanosoma brucei gambiense (strain MHOM/CI/86/DAL972) TaxID=679716 RepID=C9ZNL1_TRYB9|nr:oligosaccharyl transferase subunit, putative [Trypanosoma brucei gambiense DAL972]CBH10989.1 oligosaccharyl transferase subunit, putative [Trypanosoma brucei gambiense DAL972]|eukprot:XP_011773276.1 oligosaccharyl transferase subunit, putative [Trypanosoma brucei gambiense DAL972]